MKTKWAGLVYELFIALTGTVMVWMFANWQVWLGIYLMIWANNRTIKRLRE